MKYLLFNSVIIIALCSNKMNKNEQQGYIPKDGFVPNAETAIKIAEAVWLPIYGDNIYDKKQFVAKLIDSTIWIVSGTLQEERSLGGIPYIKIQKKDGKILIVEHSK